MGMKSSKHQWKLANTSDHSENTRSIDDACGSGDDNSHEYGGPGIDSTHFPSNDEAKTQSCSHCHEATDISCSHFKSKGDGNSMLNNYQECPHCSCSLSNRHVHQVDNGMAKENDRMQASLDQDDGNKVLCYGDKSDVYTPTGKLMQPCSKHPRLIQLGIDPRSPSNNIQRTPIQIEVTPAMIEDPRSPTDGINRTPIVCSNRVICESIKKSATAEVSSCSTQNNDNIDNNRENGKGKDLMIGPDAQNSPPEGQICQGKNKLTISSASVQSLEKNSKLTSPQMELTNSLSDELVSDSLEINNGVKQCTAVERISGTLNDLALFSPELTSTKYNDCEDTNETSEEEGLLQLRNFKNKECVMMKANAQRCKLSLLSSPVLSSLSHRRIQASEQKKRSPLTMCNDNSPRPFLYSKARPILFANSIQNKENVLHDGN